MKDLFPQLVKLESISLVIKTNVLTTLQTTRAEITITDEVLSSFTRCENRYDVLDYLIPHLIWVY